jgi:hypothetical protein
MTKVESPDWSVMSRAAIADELQRRIETLLAPRAEQTRAIGAAIRDLTRYQRYGELPLR